VRSTFCTAVLLVTVALGGTACAPPPDIAQVKREIIARENASFAAWQRKDKAFYDEYWADDMTEFLPDSPGLTRKSEMMPRFDEMAKRWQLDSLRIVDPEVRLYGDVAVLTYTEAVAGKYDGQPSRYTGKVSMIYVKQRGSWRGVHYHESK
jgi:ketosteroid isomerase-like protein